MSKGEQTRKSFSLKNCVSTSKPFKLLHMDLFGPSRTMSLGGNLYGLVVVDDYSRYTWTLFLHTKKDAYSEFKKLGRKLQNMCCSNNIGAIRSDHGRQFQNEKFISFCSKLGISHHFSAPRTPQQNGVSGKQCTCIMAELYEGICGSHIGDRALSSKAIRAGYYWPTMREDCTGYAQQCKQSTTKETPFSLVHGSNVMIPVEI